MRSNPFDPYGLAGTEFYHLDEQYYVLVVPDVQNMLRSAVLPGFWIDATWLWPAGRFITVRQALGRIEAEA